MSAKNWGIGTVVAVLGLIGAAQAVDWEPLIPMTRASHAADMAALEASYKLEMEAVSEGIDKFYANWQCDEWIEELDDLLDKQRVDDSPQLAERIQRLRDKIDENDCDRFE